eukprot:5355706-Amphidinium_carterae.1
MQPQASIHNVPEFCLTRSSQHYNNTSSKQHSPEYGKCTRLDLGRTLSSDVKYARCHTRRETVAPKLPKAFAISFHDIVPKHAIFHICMVDRQKSAWSNQRINPIKIVAKPRHDDRKASFSECNAHLASMKQATAKLG